MFFDFSEQAEIYEVSIYIEVDGQPQRQAFTAPKMFIIQQFLSLIQQAINTNQRVCIEMRAYIKVYSEKLNKMQSLPSILTFKNNAYLNNEETNE